MLRTVGTVWPNVTAEDVLAADKMDILYGTHLSVTSEHSKFSVWFYQMVYDIATEIVDSDILEDVYEETVRFIEVAVSSIEQNVIFTGVVDDREDLVVLCLFPTLNAIYFFTD